MRKERKMDIKKIVIGAGCLAIGATLALASVLTNVSKETFDKVGADDDFYSITINVDEVTTSDSFSSGSIIAKTDQLHNDVGIAYENLRLYEEKSYSINYLEFQDEQSGAGAIYNTTSINSMLSLSMAFQGSFKLEWGWKVGNDIVYSESITTSHSVRMTETYDFHGDKPNYFRMSNNSVDAGKADGEIYIKLDKDCVVSENPNIVINGIKYSKKNNHYAVLGFSGSSFNNIVLETMIDGVPVTEILDSAFRNNSSIASVNLGNITKIGDYAFDGCNNLTSISSYSSVEHFGKYSFGNCGSLATSLSFTASDVYFDSYSFYSCSSIASLRFEDGCAAFLNNSAFGSLSSLQSIYIGDAVENIMEYNFSFTSKLETIEVNNNNISYCAEENVLYEKNGIYLTLVKMASKRTQTTYVMPNNVSMMKRACCTTVENLQTLVLNNLITGISKQAFDYCYSLRNVTFGSNIQLIDNYSFEGCAFTSITIPSSVQKVGSKAFQNCNQLQSVVFEEGCTRLCYQAFNNCWLLSSVVLPESLDYVGSYDGFGSGEVFESCPSLVAVCTRLTSGDYPNANASWLGTKKLLYYSSTQNDDGNHWHEVGSDDAPRIWTDKLYIQSNAEFSADGSWYAVWAWTKGDPSTGAFYYDSNAPVDYLYTISIPTSKNCFVVLRMKSGVDASFITSFPDGQFFNRTDDLENVLSDQITITQWDNGMGYGNLGIKYSIHSAA